MIGGKEGDPGKRQSHALSKGKLRGTVAAGTANDGKKDRRRYEKNLP